MFPALNRLIVETVSYLIYACCHDRSVGFVEIEAGIIPFQAAGVKEAACLGFLVTDQRLVVEVEDFDVVDVMPVIH